MTDARVRKAARALGVELLDTLVAIRDATQMYEQPEQTRLNDIYDLANASIEAIHRGAK